MSAHRPAIPLRRLARRGHAGACRLFGTAKMSRDPVKSGPEPTAHRPVPRRETGLRAGHSGGVQKPCPCPEHRPDGPHDNGCPAVLRLLQPLFALLGLVHRIPRTSGPSASPSRPASRRDWSSSGSARAARPIPRFAPRSWAPRLRFWDNRASRTSINPTATDAFSRTRVLNTAGTIYPATCLPRPGFYLLRLVLTYSRRLCHRWRRDRHWLYHRRCRDCLYHRQGQRI